MRGLKLLRVRDRVQAQHADPAAAGRAIPFEDLDGGRLAGPVRPEQREHLAALAPRS